MVVDGVQHHGDHPGLLVDECLLHFRGHTRLTSGLEISLKEQHGAILAAAKREKTVIGAERTLLSWRRLKMKFSTEQRSP